MSPSKLFTIPDAVTPSNFEEVMQQAITLELATIPTYLSTYYSINRAQDQNALFDTLKSQLTKAGQQECQIYRSNIMDICSCGKWNLFWGSSKSNSSWSARVFTII